MNPKVLSIFNNAKIFLSESEMNELRNCIDNEFEKPKANPKKQSKALDNWTIESVTERLLATQFHPSNKKHLRTK